MFLLSLLPPDALAKRPLAPVPASAGGGVKPASLKQRARILDLSMESFKMYTPPHLHTKERVAAYRARIEAIAEPGLTADQLVARLTTASMLRRTEDDDNCAVLTYSRRVMRHSTCAAYDDV
jgi:hypothetical protein